jgi:hypothetical protein
MDLILYQTLDDKGNPDDVESEGPFICKREHSWLGNGYYFWDAHIELGHWWGELNVRQGFYKDGYIICKANAILDSSCWDLYGNGLYRKEFDKICKLLIDENVTTKSKLLVSHVIEYLKKKSLFKYKAIRMLGVNTISSNSSLYFFRVPFVNHKQNNQYFDVYPPVQICLIEKSALSLKNYSIVFPDEYIETYA